MFLGFELFLRVFMTASSFEGFRGLRARAQALWLIS